MAIDFPNTSGGTTHYLRWSGTPVSAYPLSVHARFRGDTFADASDSGALLGGWRSGAAIGRFGLYAGISGDGRLKAFIENDAGSVAVTASGSVMTAGAWHSCVGVFTRSGTTTTAAVYLDGDAGATATGNVVMPSVDRITSGRWDDSTPNLGLDGRVSDLAVWSVALSAEDRAALAGGLSPLLVQPAALAFFASCDSATPQDLIGQLALTVGGSPTAVESPMSVLGWPMAVTRTAAAAVGGFQPAWARQRSAILGGGLGAAA